MLVVFWERLAAGLMLSLLALYLREHRSLAATQVFLVVGGYLGGSYLLSVPGGAVADGRLGHLRAAICGVVLLLLGQLALLSDATPLIGPALFLMLVGAGLFRVAIPTLIGRLYNNRDDRRESAFGIVYAGINVGYLLGPLFGEWMRARYGWPPIFIVAVLALFIALCILYAGRRRIMRETTHLDLATRLEPSHIAQRVRAIYLLCGIAVVFWLAMQQTSTSLAFVAEDGTIPRLRPGYYAAFHGGAVLILTPLLFAFMKQLHRRAPSQPMRLVWGLFFTAAAFVVLSAACLRSAATRLHALWLFGTYLLLSTGEVLHSAMGLSLVAQLSPPRLSGRMNGLWFAAVAGGNIFAGVLGLLWTRLPHHRYFALIAALLIVAGMVLLWRSERLEKMLRV